MRSGQLNFNSDFLASNEYFLPKKLHGNVMITDNVFKITNDAVLMMKGIDCMAFQNYQIVYKGLTGKDIFKPVASLVD